MNVRILLAEATGIIFLFAVSTQDLRAAAGTCAGPGEGTHTLAKADLHAAVLAASAEAASVRKCVQDFLARSEVRNQIERIGFEPVTVASRVALLSDSELLRLQSQIMSADEQIRTAGMPGWGIALITVGVVLGILLIVAIATGLGD